MKITRLTAIILLAAIFLLSGLLFWPYLLKYILEPIALVSWILLRIFVLSIDQHIFWIALSLIGLIVLFRLLSKIQTTLPEEKSFVSNDTIEAVEYWRIRFLPITTNADFDKSLRRELIYLLASFYASKQRGTNYEIYEALQRGQIPLPEHIQAILFPQEPKDSKSLMKKLIQSIRWAPRKLLYRWTGQEKAERLRLVNDVLSYIEASMEFKNDR